MVVEDIKRIVHELEQEHQMSPIGVQLVDNELALLYMNSKKSENDFRDYPPLLRQAVSLARRVQDPLVEFAQVCSSDEDIVCLKFHPLQEQVIKEELLNALYCEFINRVNEVGVDVNRAITHPHTQALVQYVCGLGPRKGSHLQKILKQNNTRLENRTQLVTMCHMGPKVFINCAGFIKIDTASLGDSTDSYIEVLDGSRVHPETYEWARKMAVDALEYDESAEDANPAGALEEILENPERLKDLDLDAFAEELERQGYGNKGITLYDIRAELSCRIMKIDIEKFSVDLTCRTSDLMDKNNEWKLPKDTYYDFDSEAADQKVDDDAKKKQQRTTYIKRVIVHPSFHNINFKQAEKMMETMDQGDVIIRPSSKGANHLTVTWKVTDGIYQHIDVREEGKENAFSLGQSLLINNEEFEDLDEITARYVQPMASFARDLLYHKYYQDCSGGDLGRVEYVTVTPEGYRYRGQVFPTVNGLFRWFKDHFQDPVPDLTRAVNALPQNMTTQMFNAIAAVTGQGQNPNATPAQWGSSQYGYGGSSAYH
eukprot:g47548.t1